MSALIEGISRLNTITEKTMKIAAGFFLVLILIYLIESSVMPVILLSASGFELMGIRTDRSLIPSFD